MEPYPVLNEDIFFATVKTIAHSTVRVHNTTTGKDYKLNPAAITLLQLCTGTHTLAEIAHILAEQEGEPVKDVADSVDKASAVLQEKGIITLRPAPLKKGRPTAKEITVSYAPHTAHLEITNKCNLSCIHCANNSGNPYPDELTTKEILSLIDTLSSMGVTRIVLTGGEALLHPDLYTIIEHARKAPMRVDIFTNCTLITKEHIKKFNHLGVNRIATSIDSINESVHDTFRGQKGALKRALRGIALLQKAGFFVRVSISVAQATKDHIIEVIKYLGEQDLTDYQIAPVKFSGRGIHHVVISPEEFYQILVDEFTYLKRERPDDVPDPPQKIKGGCGIAKDSIYIKADGTILPCHGCHKDMNVGNIRDGDLIDVWDNNETLTMFRSMEPEDDNTCAECQYVSFCGGCIAGAFIYEGKIRCYDPYTCANLRAYNDVFGMF